MAGSFRGEFAGGFNVKLDTSQVKWGRITEAVQKKQRFVLFGTGAYGAKVIDRSIRKAGKRGGRAHTSKPGTPPKYHVKPGLKGNFYFNVDLKDASVAIGPGVQINGGSKNVVVHAASGAELLEFGGNITFKKTKKRKKEVTAHVKARPFLRPALEDKIKPIFYRNIERYPLK